MMPFKLKILAAAMAELGLMHIRAPGPRQHIIGRVAWFPA